MNAKNLNIPSQSFPFCTRVGCLLLAGLLAFACVGLSTASAQFGEPDSHSGPIRRVGERPVTERPTEGVLYRLEFLRRFSLSTVRKMTFETGEAEEVVSKCEVIYNPEMPREASVTMKIEMVSDPSIPVVTLEDKISLAPEVDIDRALYRDLGSLLGPSMVLEDRFNLVLNAHGFGGMIDSELIDIKFDTQYDVYRLYRERSDAEFLVYWVGIPRHRIVEEVLRY